MFKDNILSNGSYKLSKWAKDIFGIRLYRNANYSGDFVAKNAAVFLSNNQELLPSEVLVDEDADMAFIDSHEIPTLKNLDFEIKSCLLHCYRIQRQLY